MKNKYFFTKKFSCCPLNSLIPDEIKETYTNTKELNKHTIQRGSYLGEVSRVLGFPKWGIYQQEFETKILPFMEQHGLKDYAPSLGKNILKAEHDISFSYRQVADRLFFDERPLPKKIFTGYQCKTDNFAYYCPRINHLKDLQDTAEDDSFFKRFNITNDLIYANNYDHLKTVINSNHYKEVQNHNELDYLIPMDLGHFKAFHHLLTDIFILNDHEVPDQYLIMQYENYGGLVEDEKFTKISKLLKEHLLTIKKGWLEIIPFNDNLIFLKAQDGSYDYIFKNLRDQKFKSVYGDYIKPECIPSILNEDYDFKRWLYYGFKKKKSNIKAIKPLELWKEKDEHLSEINFYQTNEQKNYPGSNQILKNFYIKEGLYTYNSKTSRKQLEGFEQVELEDKILNISQLITIKEFFKFYNEEYEENRSHEVEEIFTNNIEDENYPVSVTWYDAIAYCKYIEKKFNVPTRLINAEEFKFICPRLEETPNENEYKANIAGELDFFYNNKQLSTPPAYMADFDNVIMKFRKAPEFIKHNNLDFCINTTFKEWSNHFRDGYARVLNARYPNIEINQHTMSLNAFQANLNYKYKYQKVGFRVCYESPKDSK